MQRLRTLSPAAVLVSAAFVVVLVLASLIPIYNCLQPQWSIRLVRSDGVSLDAQIYLGAERKLIKHIPGAAAEDKIPDDGRWFVFGTDPNIPMVKVVYTDLTLRPGYVEIEIGNERIRMSGKNVDCPKEKYEPPASARN
jgi:hypothetical protein